MISSKTCNCTNCKKPIFGRYYKEIDDKPVCDYCVELECFQCSGCKNYFYLDDIGYVAGEDIPYYCEDCLGRYVTSCDECDEMILIDDSQYINGGCYCKSCASEIDENNDED